MGYGELVLIWLHPLNDTSSSYNSGMEGKVVDSRPMSVCLTYQ